MPADAEQSGAAAWESQNDDELEAAFDAEFALDEEPEGGPSQLDDQEPQHVAQQPWEAHQGQLQGQQHNSGSPSQSSDEDIDAVAEQLFEDFEASMFEQAADAAEQLLVPAIGMTRSSSQQEQVKADIDSGNITGQHSQQEVAGQQQQLAASNIEAGAVQVPINQDAPISTATADVLQPTAAPTVSKKRIVYEDFEGLDGSDDEQPAAANTSLKQQGSTDTAADGDGREAKRRRVVLGSRTQLHRVTSEHVENGAVGRVGQTLPADMLAATLGAAANGGGCAHPSYYMGMCVQCGASKSEEEESMGQGTGQGVGQGMGQAAGAGASTVIKHLHSKGHLEVSAHEAQRLRQLEANRLRAAQKLVLILDLDHTLVNSVKMSDLLPEHTAMLENMLSHEDGAPDRLLYCLRDKNLWTKLRPGVHAFLEALRPLYELHIYTMGDRSYAAEMRRILDPQNKLFVSTISQCDSTSTAQKDLDVAMAEERMVLIMDDTEQVWPRHKRNLLHVDRYHYFPASMRAWGVSGSALLERGVDESATEGTLSTCAGVLRDVHSSFYSPAASTPLERRDVRYLLAQRRQRILAGCVVVFSSCWPLDYPAPYQHPLWQLAEHLGAEVGTSYDKELTTHVVAAVPDTEKAHRARADSKHVVAPQWLHACNFRWQRMPEDNFPPVSRKRATAKQQAAQPHGQQAAPAGAAQLDDAAELARALASAGGGGGQQ